jgi:hypothetical protein
MILITGEKPTTEICNKLLPDGNNFAVTTKAGVAINLNISYSELCDTLIEATAEEFASYDVLVNVDGVWYIIDFQIIELSDVGIYVGTNRVA